jgi:NAD-dependent deacetylase
MLDPAALDAAAAAAQTCDVMLVVGTSGLVYPAAGFPASARRAGAVVLTVNPEPTDLDSIASVCIRGKAAEVLPRLLEAAQ